MSRFVVSLPEGLRCPSAAGAERSPSRVAASRDGAQSATVYRMDARRALFVEEFNPTLHSELFEAITGVLIERDEVLVVAAALYEDSLCATTLDQSNWTFRRSTLSRVDRFGPWNPFWPLVSYATIVAFGQACIVFPPRLFSCGRVVRALAGAG